MSNTPDVPWAAPGAMAGPTAHRADTARLGVWLALIALSMVFLGLIGCFIVVRAGASRWPPDGVQLNLPLGAVNTAVIAASSTALAGALARARAGDGERSRTLILLAGGLALLFLALQSIQYYFLLTRFGHTIGKSQFGAYFYSLTGLHALHLAAGVVWLGALSAGRKPRSALLVELCAMYWHFVALLWGLLFVLLYLV